MHMDVSRNFHTKEQIMKLLDVMAMYKMNKFHFHLTDDEGWRLEIPGLEELTQVGARRGHVNTTDLSSLLPLLGSGPGFDTSGSGYYSVEEYREILRYAKQRHIEVIPEIDMPGHSHAAIRSMKARHQKYMAVKDKQKANEYLLSDLDHDISSGSHSVQMYSENAMNPGMESTYKFVNKIVIEVKEMHKDIMPLRVFHFGGDEVPYEAWEGSPACMSLIDADEVKSSEDLMEYFVSRVADIVAKNDLDVGAWQDGIIPDESDLKPIARHKFKSKNVYVYAWQNVWESGLSGCAYRLANSGYKVVMSQGTHLYFDHPYEPDPEERGLYWACRFCDSRKTFTFMPDNIYANADVKLTGEKLSKDYIKRHKEDHDDLKKPENVIGIQAQLWTELVRTWDQMDSMIFPRLLCVAERAWHKADWELEPDKEKMTDQQFKDWSYFASQLGCKELARLDTMGVAYHLPPPGAHCLAAENKLEFNSAYPGLPIFYSTDKGNTWTRYTDKIDTIPNIDIYLCTKSVDEKRTSRVVIMKKPEKVK
ncbi:beta-hexosaminidase-like isoform X2 [Ruditapes philippinarum]|uniref:beta-hexosaminidase-like isoform X2 n=1 Tax=Ruditapes philippinarum TaxID=129788 RepID=UPI00295AC76B|nr:beta-hexosaminidase-like isoform X2 [Ruditapes philippinarum]